MVWKRHQNLLGEMLLLCEMQLCSARRDHRVCRRVEGFPAELVAGGMSVNNAASKVWQRQRRQHRRTRWQPSSSQAAPCRPSPSVPVPAGSSWTSVLAGPDGEEAGRPRSCLAAAASAHRTLLAAGAWRRTLWSSVFDDLSESRRCLFNVRKQRRE